MTGAEVAAERSVDFERATVADAMHYGVITCPHGEPLRLVASMMAASRVHCIVVFDERNEKDEGRSLWGIVSDLDLATALGHGEVDGRTAGQIAASPVVTVATDDTLRHAAQLMAEHSSAHLLAVDRTTGLPAGVLSTLDLARVAAGGTQA